MKGKQFKAFLILFCLISTTVTAQNKQEVTVELYKVSSMIESDEFSQAESLRKGGKYDEAIEAYTAILNSDAVERIKAESNYDVGFCYMKKHEFEKAEKVFNGVLAAYPNNNESTGFSMFCLAEIDIWKNNPENALTKLKEIVNRRLVNDDFCAAAQLKIVNVYLSMPNGKASAKSAFNKLIGTFKDAQIVKNKIVDHYQKFLK